MATVTIKFNSAYVDKNGKSPVVFIVRNKKSHAHIPSGVKTTKNYWDEKKWIKKGCTDVLDHNHSNARLLKKLGELQDFIAELTASGEVDDLTAIQIKERYDLKTIREKYNFTTYFKYVISTKNTETKRIYQNTFDRIQKYIAAELSFSDINAKFLREFEAWNKGSVNGTGLHMRNIRHVFNMAIDDEVISPNLYPFRRFKIKREETKKRNLNVEDLRRLKSVELFGVPQLARDIFMLQFYLIGINLKDLCYLPKSVISKDRIDYARSKTQKQYYLTLEPEAIELIKKLSGSKYLINVSERYQNYDSIKKEINKKLKVAAKAAGIKEKISTYWSRHSWATIAHNLNIPEETIALALGHNSAHKTTSIYIERNIDKIAKANKQVVTFLNLGPYQKV